MIALRRTRGTAIRPRRAIHVDVNVNVNLYPNSVLRSHGRPAPDARLVPSTGRRYVSGGVTSLRIWTGGRLFLRHLRSAALANRPTLITITSLLDHRRLLDRSVTSDERSPATIIMQKKKVRGYPAPI